MKRQIPFNVTFLLFFVLVFGMTSCKKTKTAEKEEPVVENTVTLDKSTVLPGDVVTISTNFPLSAKSLTLSIGDKQTTLVPTEEKKAMFIVPVLSSGNYAINFSAIGVKTAASITVSAYQPISDPKVVFDQFKNDATVALTDMAVLKNDPIAPLSTADYAFVVDLNTQLNTIYATLSAEEKLQAAYTLQKLSFIKADMTSLDNSKDFYAVSSSNSVAAQSRIQVQAVVNNVSAAEYTDPGESLVRTGKKFVTSMSFTAASVGIGVLALEVPEPSGLSKLVAVAAGITAGYHLSQSLTLVGRICNQFGISSSINDPVFRSSSSSLNVSSRSAQLFTANAVAGLTLYNNAPVTLEITSKFRTLTTVDAGSSNDLIKSIFQSEQQLASMYNSLQSAFNKVKSWFSGKSPALPGYTSKLKATSAEKDFYLPASTLSIGNVSDATVNLATTTQDGNLVLTASSSTGTAEKPLSFELTYKNATLGASVKKTVNATYDPGTPILGKWLIKSHRVIDVSSDGMVIDDTFNKFIPEGSWTFKNDGTVKLFNPNDTDSWMKFVEDNIENVPSFVHLGLFMMRGSGTYTTKSDKKTLTIAIDGHPPGSVIPFEVVTLNSTTLEIKLVSLQNSATFIFTRQ